MSSHPSIGLYDTIKSKKDGRIYLKVHSSFKTTPIGYIEPDAALLVVTDKDNLYLWNKQNPHLGLDRCILFAKLLDYHYIMFNYKKKKYHTTRKFFLRNSRPHKLFNGRDMIFLPLREFDLARAIRADMESNVVQLELF